MALSSPLEQEVASKSEATASDANPPSISNEKPNGGTGMSLKPSVKAKKTPGKSPTKEQRSQSLRSQKKQLSCDSPTSSKTSASPRANGSVQRSPRLKLLSRSVSYSCTSSLQSHLTPAQKKALMSTWKHLSQNGAGAIMERIFQKLIICRPRMKDIFYKAAFVQLFSRYGTDAAITTLHDHGRILVKLFDDVISNLERSEGIMNDISDLGGKHAFLRKSGLKAEVWENFGEVAVEIIGSQDCIKTNNDAMRAWTVVVACVTDQLRHGFEQESRNSDRKPPDR